ncbi:HlyD family efflux transporter periplasmic adaptor subunit [Methylobacterium sp. Leaf466]|uniref:efflux RND transporter periplasmic adaptor subunit n=1 Tax=Methylobacterium sp. Leaf466 TaxID=1736386 RepID=UPI0006F46328|nr:HlyD family efflux transporter periplasmic adaptor subunit [Methylobacterium sp. Leaf466]KQT80820.1 RND transporter [Methylobacterium sp. Leaf466]
MSARSAAALGAAMLLAVLVPSPAPAHEGHDHAAPPPPVTRTMGPRAEAASDTVELVAMPRDGRLVIFLDGFRTNRPLAGATVEIETPDGPGVAEPAGPGVYTLSAPWLAKPGRHDLIATVATEAGLDVLTLSLDIPVAGPGEGAALAPTPPRRFLAAVEDLRERLALKDPAVVTAAAAGFLLGVLLLLVAGGRRSAPAVAAVAVAVTVLVGTAALAAGGDEGAGLARGAALSPPRQAATDLAQRLPDGSVFVPKPTQHLLGVETAMTESARFRRTVELPGRVIPDPDASGVVQSSIGGRIAPPPSGLFPRLGSPVRKGDVLALVAPPVQAIDVSDMRQRQGELDQQIAIVARRVDRFGRLAATGAVAQTQLDDARAELAGLRDRRAALDTARREPEALVAPVDGVVAQAAAVAGQMATPGAMVFQIVDPTRLWVEALSFDALTTAQDASAHLADGRSLALAYRGSGLSDRNQAIPVQFAVRGDTAGLRIGQFVTVLAVTDAEQGGVALPRASVVRAGNGQDIVYEHTTAERFTARPVRVAPLDAARVLVAEGIGPGRRVVTLGAELLDQVR